LAGINQSAVQGRFQKTGICIRYNLDDLNQFSGLGIAKKNLNC